MTAEAQGGFSAVERESEPEPLCNKKCQLACPMFFGIVRWLLKPSN